MDTSLIQIEQSKSGRVTATLYLNSLYLFTVGSKDDTISVGFTYSDTNTLLCSTTGSATRFKSCPSEMSSLISKSCVSVSCSGSAPIESGQSMQSVTADLTICPSNNLSCGRHSDTLVSDSVSLMGSGTVPITTTRLLPITSKIVPTTTEYVEPTTTTSEVDESPTATVTSTAIPQSGAGSSTNPAVIAICVAAGIIILIAIGLIVYCRRSIWRERMNRAGTDNDTFKVSELANALTPPPKTNAAFNNAAPVPLGVLENPSMFRQSIATASRTPCSSFTTRNYIPQAQVHPAGLVSRVSQPYHGQVEAHPSQLALPQTPQYPGYYDQFGNYYFYSSQSYSSSSNSNSNNTAISATSIYN
ncbi:hypothetical protein BCR33DRAFT_723239 [Rhizoclosmatium globosum]|uniref:Uncharacterized protein n=1 Tax=Rhizoclosmatium globosum TaxID=329046 RepID=A0A1Y2BGQ3_9FUNG|nr:hypothetical protein BCR33DRAFT_723239 [Rhizoclosmatium globosum]|eukprot:ORY33265.1 hypothetical protein BCR33DRAFT_723239 [Rhizoclosmatium globosum]